MKLTDSAAKLLQVVVDQIRKNRFNPAKPQTFLSYGEAMELVQLPPNAPRGPTDGVTLQINGMQDLAIWLHGHMPPLPAITGLIVSTSSTDINGERRTPFVPGRKFFTVFKRKDEDVTWWLDQARKAIAFDWTPYLPSAPTAPASRAMNSLERTLIEKAGYANGFENVRESNPERVVLFSARHRAEAHVTPALTPDGPWPVNFPASPPSAELARTLPEMQAADGAFEAQGEASLGRLLRRAAELAMSLPNQAADTFAREAAKIDAAPPSSTEALRLVKQRIGQDIYRQALMDYWGGACAVTGIAVPELLRASHAKPWARCDTDAERLNSFNGFLLCAHLDALFDRGLMTFDELGAAVFSACLNFDTLQRLALSSPMKLRWLAPEHSVFLQWHRTNLFQSAATPSEDLSLK